MQIFTTFSFYLADKHDKRNEITLLYIVHVGLLDIHVHMYSEYNTHKTQCVISIMDEKWEQLYTVYYYNYY